MNRLTFKSHSKNGTEYYRYAHKWKRIGNTNIRTSNKYSQITQKLGKLEDIEQELGIPLEVLFKALKNGVYIKDDRYNYPLDVELRHDYMREKFYLEITDDRYSGYLDTNSEDYGKTWTLTREELEDAKD